MVILLNQFCEGIQKFRIKLPGISQVPAFFWVYISDQDISFRLDSNVYVDKILFSSFLTMLFYFFANGIPIDYQNKKTKQTVLREKYKN